MAESDNQSKTPSEKNIRSSDDIKALRTFESDAAEILRQGGAYTAKAVAQTQSKPREAESQTVINPLVDHSGRNKTMLAISGILFLSGLIVFAAYLLLQPKELPPPPLTSLGQPIINVDSQKTLDLSGLTKKKALDMIIKERDGATVRLNSTVLLTLIEKAEDGVTRALTASEFLQKLSSSAPSGLLRSLEDTYALGLIGFDGNQPFLILRTNSFESAYNGMLTFETDLFREAGSIFVLDPQSVANLSTSTGTYLSTDPSRQLFRDFVSSNLDIRAITDKNGNIVFLYSFPNQSTLVFTTNTKTFKEIIERLRRAQLVK